MKIRIVILLVVGLLLTPTTFAQEQQPPEDPRLAHLANRILTRIPDIPSTRYALGRRAQRPEGAVRQARAILAAADVHETHWDTFAQRGGWTHWNSHQDLPALIAAMALRETYMQPIVRMDGGARVRHLPTTGNASLRATGTINVREMQQQIARRRASHRGRVIRSDMGVMQVRAPSGPARACGVRTNADHHRLATDLAYGYLVGACVMTNHIDHFVDLYRDPQYQRLRPRQRPNHVLRFYGVWGDRRDTEEAALARELLVLERYNWGGRNMYLHPRAAGYAQRVIREFEFFRAEPTEPTPPGEG